MVLFGSHLGENAHNSQVQEFVRGAGPRRAPGRPRPALQHGRPGADVWLPVKPGSDLAVILAWLHLLLAEGTYDRAFVAARCLGFDELPAHVARRARRPGPREQAGVPEARSGAPTT